MKKMISFVLCVLLIMSISACGSNENGSSKTQNATNSVSDVLEQGIAEADSSPAAEAQTEKQMSETRQSGINENAPEPESAPSDGALSQVEGIDVDLTTLSSTMVYSEVYNMMLSPEDYIGKTVKMKGQFSMYHDESTDNYYFACIISDATACCSQGIEFVLTEDYTYPEDYPEEGGEVCVIGTFDTYQEGEYTYCTLRNAVLA